MNTEIQTQEKKLSVIEVMATKYGMEKAAFESVLKETVMPGNVKKEEFVAFLSVAKEYNLNPLTKEIYAFPGKGGGIQPIVSVDGWVRIINDHPQLDGIEFKDVLNGQDIIAVECKIFRKDRKHPITATEYLIECKKNSEPWKQWPRRMLRHKALIQCARYAFGFSGIVDPDEAERIRDVTNNNVVQSNTTNTASTTQVEDALAVEDQSDALFGSEGLNTPEINTTKQQQLIKELNNEQGNIE